MMDSTTTTTGDKMDPKLYKREDLASIITTAVEGGIGYWAQVTNHETLQTSDGYDLIKRIELFDHEDGEAGPETAAKYTVTLNDIERAVSLITSGDVQVNSQIRQWIGSGDPGMVDAEAADVLVQVAAFGKIVYG